MKFKINKKVAIIMAVLILSLALASTAFAADNYKNLKAWFGDIKIFNNNTPVQLKDQPFIVDGTTYLPVRSVAEMLGKDITWNGTTRQIGINDKPGTSYGEMQNKFIVQEVKLIELESKIKDLEAKLKVKEEEAKVITVKDMEKQLNKDHDRYNSVDFDISLYGTQDKLEVRIYADSYNSNTKWDTFTSTQKEKYLQDIVNDILKEFKNATITGYVEQSKTSGKLSTFTISSRGTVILTTGPGNVDRNDIYELERNLSYYIGRDGIKDIKLNERSNRLEISISVYNTEWIYLTYAQQTNILKNIYKDILYYNSYYTYNDISGEVLDYTYNNYPLNTFYYDSIGNVTLK